MARRLLPEDHRAFLVKHWQETASILERMQTTDTGRPAALATAVAISGSAYRRPGAKLLVDERGWTVRAGFVVAQTGTP